MLSPYFSFFYTVIASQSQYKTNGFFNLSKSKISVNIVNPGHIYTENGRWGQKKDRAQGEFENFISSNIPAGRMGTLDDVSSVVLNLLENSNSGFLTGATLNLDGGTSLLL